MAASMHVYSMTWALALPIIITAIDPFKDDLSKFDLRPKFNTHPMLYFTEAYTPIFRRRAETTHKHIIKDIVNAKNQIIANPQYFMPSRIYKKFAGDWNEMYGNNLPVLAIYSLLYPDDTQVYDYILQYMDNMVDVGNWQVIGQELDEVPINHQLAGFATAFDFLYPRFDKRRQVRYAQKIVNVTYEMYELSYKRWWGRAYIQNHVATNTVGLLIGALVSRLHVKEADQWLERAISHYERTMWLFERVGDGSSNEGVAYGGYTARSLTEYVYLVRRHFNRDHTQSRWLQEHFWFYYATVLPGFQWTVGIADSAPSWWYGPESQLVFLDNYVLKNGSGNWLAQQIRDHRENNYPGYGQRWTTLHTEFIWYNASLPPMPPLDHGVPRVHLFPDWGVATYGFATEKYKNTTFLSFKSSFTHGKVVFNYIRDNASFLDGWDNFNPGHEHPDKNSFVFAPNGEQFITEGLYGPKYTYLDNTLMFGPENASFCMMPWVGQLGDCSKWLQVNRNQVEEGRSHAHIINVEQRDGFVHLSGDSATAYPPNIGLVSSYRNLVLLNPQLLLMHDYVEKREMSRLKHVSAFFNNYIHNFQPYQNGKYEGFYMNLTDGKYRSIYTTYGGQRPTPRIETLKAKRYMSNVNVTFALEGMKTDIAYVFYGPDVDVQNLQFLQYLDGGVRIRVITTSVQYDVTLLSNYLSGSLALQFTNNKFDVKMSPVSRLEDLPVSAHDTHVQDLLAGVGYGGIIGAGAVPGAGTSPGRSFGLSASVIDALSNSALMTKFSRSPPGVAPEQRQCLARCLFFSTVTVFIGFVIVFALATQMIFRRRRAPAITVTLCLAFVASLIFSVFSCMC